MSRRTSTKTESKAVSVSTETRAAAWAALTELADELQVLDTYLEPTNEGPPLSQMSAETNQRMSRLMARERADRFGYGRKKTGPRDPWGLDIIYPIGASQPAGRLASLDAFAHTHMELLDLERRITRGVAFCPIKRPEHVPTATRALRVRSWLHLVHSIELLAHVNTTADELLSYVTKAIDGDPSTRLAAPCPYCDRTTLVAYPRRGIIRCDRPNNRQCRCQTEGCRCAKGQRHVWRRDHGHWNLLAQLLTQRAQERAFVRRIAAAAVLAGHRQWRTAGQLASTPSLDEQLEVE